MECVFPFLRILTNFLRSFRGGIFFRAAPFGGTLVSGLKSALQKCHVISYPRMHSLWMTCVDSLLSEVNIATGKHGKDRRQKLRATILDLFAFIDKQFLNPAKLSPSHFLPGTHAVIEALYRLKCWAAQEQSLDNGGKPASDVCLKLFVDSFASLPNFNRLAFSASQTAHKAIRADVGPHVHNILVGKDSAKGSPVSHETAEDVNGMVQQSQDLLGCNLLSSSRVQHLSYRLTPSNSNNFERRK
eukprot:Selendium_serpulae@DN5870_c3_g1_i1.p1